MSVTRLAAAVLACLAGLPAVAAEEDQSTWETALQAGWTMTDGNSRSFQIHAGILSEGEREDLGTLRLGADFRYGENRTEGTADKTADQGRAFVSARRTLRPRFYWNTELSILFDALAEVDYRAVFSPGFGVYLLQTDRLDLSVDGGPAYLWEKVGGERDEYPALRLGERMEIRLSPTAKAWQALEFLPKAENLEVYLLRAEAGIEAALNSRAALRAVLENQYDSTPGEGLKHNDLAVLVGLSLTL